MWNLLKLHFLNIVLSLLQGCIANCLKAFSTERNITDHSLYINPFVFLQFLSYNEL